MSIQYKTLEQGMPMAVAERTILRKVSEISRETWEDVAKRVALGNSLLCPQEDDRERERLILERAIGKGLVLMSGRHLQHGDRDQPKRSQEVFTNCLHRSTKIMTLERGPVEIGDIVGQKVTVKARDGEWREATVSSHGKQKLYSIGFTSTTGRKDIIKQSVIATADHRWFLRDGSVTTSLKEGDVIEAAPSQVNLDEEAIRHGLIFGDGSAHKNRIDYEKPMVSQGRTYASIRLCGADKKYLEYFKTYNVSYPPHAGGDPVVYLGKRPFWKEFPFCNDPEYIAGFIYGWWLADGSKTFNGGGQDRIEISTTRFDAIEWLKDYAAYAGYVFAGMSTYQRKDGDGSFEHGKTLYSIRLSKNTLRKVVSIVPHDEDEVFCVEEPVTQGFILGNGLLTGNCATAPSSFLLFYLLLNGSGVGRSYDNDLMLVDWDNAPNLRCVLSDTHPDFDYSRHESVRDAKHKYGAGKNVMWHKIGDSREDWSKALELWENAAFEKIHGDKLLILDFSDIRPKGSPIGGMQSRPASGPKELMDAFEKSAKLKGSGLAPWKQAIYVDHYFAECVLVGGARRAARMATKSWRDKNVIDFVMVKRPLELVGKNPEEILVIKGQSNPQGFLWSSNNSVTVDADFWAYVNDEKKDDKELKEHAKKVFEAVCQASYYDGTGEPGFINVDRLVQKDEGYKELLSGNYVGSKKYQVNEDTYLYLAKIARKARNKQYTQITNPCQPAWAPVLTKDGLRQFKDIDVGSEIWSETGWTKVIKKWSTGIKPVYKWTTDGYSETMSEYSFFAGTENHRVVSKGQKIEISQTDAIDFFNDDGPDGVVLEPVCLMSAKVTNVEYVGDEEVFDITVDNPSHTYWTGGLNVSNCGEISLTTVGGFCVIADVVPYHADTLDEAETAFRTATRALMRVNLMDSIYSKEVKRTNRIGVGMTGVHEFAWKFFKLGFNDLIDEKKSKEFWLTLARFNRAVHEEAVKYAKELGVTVPHTMTTQKPSGTISKLFLLTEGWHLPSMREFLRWVQFRADDPLVKDYQKRGYPIRELKTYSGTTIVGFPTAPTITRLGMGDKLITAAEATPEQQYKWLMLGEKYWINGTDEKGNLLDEKYGNQISYTLKYKPDVVSYEAFREMMMKYQSKIACCSVMPQINATAYEYQPEQPVTTEEYQAIVAKISHTKEDVGLEHVDCGSGGACPIDFKKSKD
jgi:hypothetical protein